MNLDYDLKGGYAAAAAVASSAALAFTPATQVDAATLDISASGLLGDGVTEWSFSLVSDDLEGTQASNDFPTIPSLGQFNVKGDIDATYTEGGADFDLSGLNNFQIVTIDGVTSDVIGFSFNPTGIVPDTSLVDFSLGFASDAWTGNNLLDVIQGTNDNSAIQLQFLQNADDGNGQAGILDDAFYKTEVVEDVNAVPLPGSGEFALGLLGAAAVVKVKNYLRRDM